MTQYRSPFSSRFAIGQGIMGAILGGLKYQLDLNTQQLAEQAELQKEQRLAQLQQQIKMGDEARANTEWTRRNSVENTQALARDDHQTANNIVQSRATLGNEMQLSDHNTGNDILKTKVEAGLTLSREQQLEQQRAQHAQQQAQVEADAQRRTHVFDKTYDAVAAAKDPAHYGTGREGDGVMGSDGKFYPKGVALPQGVTPTVGFGATNLGTRGTTSGRLSARTGATSGVAAARTGVPSPSTSATPAAPVNGAPHPDGTKLRGPDGRLYIVQNGIPVPL